MTLNTKVRILGEVDPRELFRHFVHLMGHDLRDDTAPPRHPDMFPARWVAEEDTDGTLLIQTVIGQGLPAWLRLRCKLDERRLPVAIQPVEEVEVDEDDGYVTRHAACFLRFNFDTAYSYRDADGLDAGAFHAKLLIDLAPWLSERGADWEWENEFTGDTYNKLDGIDTLVTSGEAADAWFRNFAQPAINNELQASRLRELEAGGS